MYMPPRLASLIYMYNVCNYMYMYMYIEACVARNGLVTRYTAHLSS